MKYITISRSYQCDLCLAQTDDLEDIEKHMEFYHKSQIIALEQFKDTESRKGKL